MVPECVGQYVGLRTAEMRCKLAMLLLMLELKLVPASVRCCGATTAAANTNARWTKDFLRRVALTLLWACR